MPPRTPTANAMAGPSNAQDELTATVFGAVESLNQIRKANFLLETSLALIESGRYVQSRCVALPFSHTLETVNSAEMEPASRYGDEVENYLDVYLRTPGLEKKDVARALLARGNARKMAGDKLLARAQQDFQAVAKLDPSNRELQGYLRRSNMVSVPRFFAGRPPE